MPRTNKVLRASVWQGIGNYKIDGQRITADVIQFEPDLFKRMALFSGYVPPKRYHQKYHREGF